MNKDFLLTDDLSKRLYHNVASSLPIIDYHNHLSVADIKENRRFENIARLWVISDPYKHRAMRILGVEEKYITGNASDCEKFKAWYTSLSRLIGNPLFDWSVMELETVFDYHLLPLGDADKVWNELNDRLSKMSACDILGKFNIEYSAPCASLCDDLSMFDKSAGLSPSLRGDDLLLPSTELLGKLSTLTGNPISSLSEYMNAVRLRLEAFASAGCKFSDHALDDGFTYIEDDGENGSRFSCLINGKEMTDADKLSLSSHILTLLGEAYAERELALQLHIGARRYTSTRLRKEAGPAGGYAAIGGCVDLKSLTLLLDAIEKRPSGLPKIILFTLNPADNAVMATLSGSYSKDGVEAVVTQGPAWWWCDHYQGICDMLDNFTVHSVLSSFVGMTTDSRSLLSFVRHDYFRRVVCKWMSDMVAKDRLPNDFALLAETLLRICYKNAKEILGGE